MDAQTVIALCAIFSVVIGIMTLAIAIIGLINKNNGSSNNKQP